MDTSKVKTRFTGHRKLVGPGRKQGKLSFKVRIHNETMRSKRACMLHQALWPLMHMAQRALV